MKLISLKDQNIDGSHNLKVGDRFEMSEMTSRLLVKLKRAKYAEDSDNPEIPKPGRYKRRDMRAQD